jgi:hypothetical protein
MSVRSNPLDYVKVASPCPADWEAMIGDERVRFCGQCQLNVYNLSGMSKREAEALVTNTEGRLCVRYHQRADGTILTKDCPVGLCAIKRRVSRVARATISAVIGFLAGVGFNFGLSQSGAFFERPVIGEMVTSKPVVNEENLFVEPVQIERATPAVAITGEWRLGKMATTGMLITPSNTTSIKKAGAVKAKRPQR